MKKRAGIACGICLLAVLISSCNKRTADPSRADEVPNGTTKTVSAGTQTGTAQTVTATEKTDPTTAVTTGLTDDREKIYILGQAFYLEEETPNYKMFMIDAWTTYYQVYNNAGEPLDQGLHEHSVYLSMEGKYLRLSQSRGYPGINYLCVISTKSYKKQGIRRI